MTAWAQDTVSAYNFGTQATLSMSGDGNTSNTTGYSVVEPISGSSIISTTNTEVIVGFLGAAGGDITPPAIFANSDLQIQENQPIGTRVGEFTTTNFESESITYSMVEGEGGVNNHLFTLSADGQLLTASVFDFEKNEPQFSIRVRASGTGNEQAERSFTISLIDENEDHDGDGVLDDADPDDDNDGYSDAYEIAIGSDPRNAASTPMNFGLVAWYPFDGNASICRAMETMERLTGQLYQPTVTGKQTSLQF